ncbi:hypothetical protein GCM10023152_19980 [Agromyces bauzanensis]|uniref:Uncharacterized protein n=1 Tax=Agromyces bauzanensis TaxID=1308924 RepID=A0A917PN82_9MICO|nr:hypothetical protein GCM10011372_25360 [Agromyces bauzanensis]
MQITAAVGAASGQVVSLQGTEIGAASPGESVARSRVESYLAVARWRSVTENAIADLGLDTTPEALDTRISVANPRDTSTIKISATADTPEGARDLAVAWLRAMIVTIDYAESDGTEGSAAVTVVAGTRTRFRRPRRSPTSRRQCSSAACSGSAWASCSSAPASDVGPDRGVSIRSLRSLLDHRA